MQINFKPSYLPEFAKIFFSFVLFGITILLIQMNIVDYTINIAKILEIKPNVEYYKELSSFNVLYILNVLFFIYVFLTFSNKSFLRFYYKYQINKENGFLLIKSGIFKAENFISIKEIRTINISTPTIWQIFSGVRTIKLEADGVEGWDAILLDVRNPKEIEKKIIEIKTEQRNRN